MADIAITCVLAPAGSLAYMQRRSGEDAHEFTFAGSLAIYMAAVMPQEAGTFTVCFYLIFLPIIYFFLFNDLCGHPFLKRSQRLTFRKWRSSPSHLYSPSWMMALWHSPRLRAARHTHTRTRTPIDPLKAIGATASLPLALLTPCPAQKVTRCS